MAALSKNRDTGVVAGKIIQLTVATGKTIYAGALVAINTSGFAEPAADAADLKVIGRANRAGAAGDTIPVQVDVFAYDNSVSSAVALKDVGSYCFVEDDQTVSTSGGTNSIVAGLVRGVQGGQVYVDTAANPDSASAGAAAGTTAGETAGAAAVAAAGNVRLVESAPTKANDEGVKGDMFWDSNVLYLCTAEDTWIKCDLASSWD